MPPGQGLLFKCIVCGTLVFESQLDFHMTTCSLPDDSQSPDLSPRQLLRQHGQTCLQAHDKTQSASSSSKRGCQVRRDTAQEESAPLVINLPGEVEHERERVWRKWEDSHIQIHHAEAEERKRQRSKRLLQEKEGREAAECSFTPRLVSRPASAGRLSSSSGCTSRLSALGPDAWLQRQLEARAEKLKRVEAAMYVDVTHRPQISRFAQRSRASSQELGSPRRTSKGSPRRTVFERLYEASSQEKVRPESQVEQPEAWSRAAMASNRSSSSFSGARSQVSCTFKGPRRPFGGLYGDALERRERQRCAEQQAQNEDRANRLTALQVSRQSRRYFWERLEKQVKVAWEGATSGKDFLTYPGLEDFLVHFGVLKRPPARATASVVAHFTKESLKLRTALWRHLDPKRAGHVDQLTLIIFFHVLMGGADEDADNIHPLVDSLKSASEEGEETVDLEDDSLAATAALLAGGSGASPMGDSPLSSASGGHCAFSSFSGPDADASRQQAHNRADTLSSIVEEASSVKAVHCSSSSSPLSKGVAVAAARGDATGQQICALLKRFKPRELRSEFRQLYLNRMHSVGPGSDREQTPPPARRMHPQNRALADRFEERVRQRALAQGHTIESRRDLMLFHYDETHAKQEQIRADHDDKEVAECTFKPRLRQGMGRSSSADAVLSSGGRGSHHTSLYLDSIARQEYREAQLSKLQAERAKAELVDCTFQPDLHQSKRSRTPTRVAMPRGYDGSTRRLRRAFAEEATRRRFLEDRYMASAQVPAHLSPPAGSINGRSLGHPTAGGGPSPRSPYDSYGVGGRPLRGELPCESLMVDIPSRRPSTAAPTAKVTTVMEPPAPGRPPGQSLAPGGGRAPATPRVAPRGSRQPTGAQQRPKALPREATRDEKEAPLSELLQDEVVVQVEVNITPGGPPKTLELRKGQTAADAAANFVVQYQLRPQLAQKLHHLL